MILISSNNNMTSFRSRFCHHGHHLLFTIFFSSWCCIFVQTFIIPSYKLTPQAVKIREQLKWAHRSNINNINDVIQASSERRRRRRLQQTTITFLKKTSHDEIEQQQQPLNDDDDDDDNDDKQRTTSSNGGRGIVITPFDIIHNIPRHQRNSSSSSSSSINKKTLPLFAAKRSIEKALRHLLDHTLDDEEDDEDDEKSSINSNMNDNDNDNDNDNNNSYHQQQRQKKTPTIIRIEEQIITPLSPSSSSLLLQWLKSSLITTSSPSSATSSVYFCNVERTFESAGYGYSSSSSPSSRHYIFNGETTPPPSFWNFLKDLPPAIKIYGGHRFDPMYPLEERGYEWDDFGGYYFMIPGVEFRRVVVDKEKKTTRTTLAVTLIYNNEGNTTPLYRSEERRRAIQSLLHLLSQSPSSVVPTITTTAVLPSIFYRDDHVMNPSATGITDWESLVEKALKQLIPSSSSSSSSEEENNKSKMEKVVLARRADVRVDGCDVHPLDALRLMRESGHVGHYFYLGVGGSGSSEERWFWGCTPERLFRVKGAEILSEALAGSRPRGTNATSDAHLLDDLFTSPKDRSENDITFHYIRDKFKEMEDEGLIRLEDNNNNDDSSSEPFARRLRHLQHICRNIRAKIINVNTNANNNNNNTLVVDVTHGLLTKLHPTPAVGGTPKSTALSFIRQNEHFDRGFYAGPFGYFSSTSSDIVVAIRSSLTRPISSSHRPHTLLSLYAGAGIVPLSAPQAEYTETSHKLQTLSSLFLPQLTPPLPTLPNINTAHATAILEELYRCGLTTYYICPGSRNTPLTVAAVALARRYRHNVILKSTIDERGAAFRAIGYARATGRPAVVLTSSGTAVGNLLPAALEASNDALPVLFLTADRPYEEREVGANQAVNQVEVLGKACRWFRDVLPPGRSGDVGVNVLLSDVNQAVGVMREGRGPVHLNVAFRENLSPDGGVIRGDKRVGGDDGSGSSVLDGDWDGRRWTDVVRYGRWSGGGEVWQKRYYGGGVVDGVVGGGGLGQEGVKEVARLLQKSRRGVIVVGNVRNYDDDGGNVMEMIAYFAEMIGFPVFADVQTGILRSKSSVIPYAEQLLKHPTISKNLQPDLIFQIGAPLVSTDVTQMIYSSLKQQQSKIKTYSPDDDDDDNNNNNNNNNRHYETLTTMYPHHILLHPHHVTERADPSFTVTHRLSSEVSPMLSQILNFLDDFDLLPTIGSDLIPLISLGRHVAQSMPGIIHEASSSLSSGGDSKKGDDDDRKNDGERLLFSHPHLTEPQIMLALSESQIVTPNENNNNQALFLSNSMPIRDGSSFLYPFSSERFFTTIAANRGASGIDGIISSATGYAEATAAEAAATAGSNGGHTHTTLVIGDLACLHDANGLYSLSSSSSSLLSTKEDGDSIPLTTIVVNNNGGGIFSFLPIAKYDEEVQFDQFWGTPTSNVNYNLLAKAMGVSEVKTVSTYDELVSYYSENTKKKQPSLIEARVVGREENVVVHKRISQLVTKTIDDFLMLKKEKTATMDKDIVVLPLTTYRSNDQHPQQKTLLLLHGWMGEQSDWKDTITHLLPHLDASWRILTIDLPGHGDSPHLHGGGSKYDIYRALRLTTTTTSKNESPPSVDDMAQSVMQSLLQHNIQRIDAVGGYSLGGRVAMSLRRRLLSDNKEEGVSLSHSCRWILLGAPPPFEKEEGESSSLRYMQERDRLMRRRNDDNLSRIMEVSSLKQQFLVESSSSRQRHWIPFLTNWYSAPLWGRLVKNDTIEYQKMMTRRYHRLSQRGFELSRVLRGCSPSRQPLLEDDNVLNQQGKQHVVMMVAGGLDSKYSKMGRRWIEINDDKALYKEIEGAGHALLVEAAEDVSRILAEFLSSEENDSDDDDIVESAIERENEISTMSKPTMTTISQPALSQKTTLKTTTIVLQSLNIESFTLDMISPNAGSTTSKKRRLFGIGWNRSASSSSKSEKQRKGYLIELTASQNDDNELIRGIGEVSPLPGLHSESNIEAGDQLRRLQSYLLTSSPSSSDDIIPYITIRSGGLSKYIAKLASHCGFQKFVPSVHSGLEMAMATLLSQAMRLPVHQVLASMLKDENLSSQRIRNGVIAVPLNGLVTRSSSSSSYWSTKRRSTTSSKTISFPSTKIKVGGNDNRSVLDDASDIANFCRLSPRARFRIDANRLWTFDEAIQVVTTAVEWADGGKDSDIRHTWEYVEEPLKMTISSSMEDGDVSSKFLAHVQQLNEWYDIAGVRYALDETLAELVLSLSFSYDKLESLLRNSFATGRQHGCAAFILKPSLLGIETSLELSQLAQSFGIASVISSSFDSGVGLSHAAMLAAVVDEFSTKSFPHGLGTFEMLDGDTLSPPFRSYVDEEGKVNVSSLGRALNGLGLEDLRTRSMRSSFTDQEKNNDDDDDDDEEENAINGPPSSSTLPPLPFPLRNSNSDYTSSSWSNGREINVRASLRLPFSHEIAYSRFADLPQQSRWSPWLNSVEYVARRRGGSGGLVGGETEWTLNVRGLKFRWRAVSDLLNDPYKGIAWESVSGLNNRGRVEFIPTAPTTSHADPSSSEEDIIDDDCVMTVTMTIIPPKVLSQLFLGTSIFVEDFLENKLLKWSLEMFRDVVKADLALQRGDIELGDALFGAVEGKASAIEATLSYEDRMKDKKDDDAGFDDNDDGRG